MLKITTPTPDVVKLTFVIPVDRVAGPVSVVGDFNDWDPMVHPLKKRSNGTRSVSVEVPAGREYHFKYLADDGSWFCEDDAHGEIVNEYGEVNSVIRT